MEYKGYDIYVHDEWAVLGDDPLAEPVRAYAAQIRKPDAESSPDGDVVWDFPFGLTDSDLTAATRDEAIEKAQAFIDAHEKRPL